MSGFILMLLRPPRSTLFHYPTLFLFFFNDTATTEIYTLSLHDALPISGVMMPGQFGPISALFGQSRRKAFTLIMSSSGIPSLIDMIKVKVFQIGRAHV